MGAPKYDQLSTIQGMQEWKLRCSEKEKTEEWYANVMRSIVPFNQEANEDYQKMVSLYGLMNNDMTMVLDELKRLCDPIEGTNPDTLKDADAIPAYNKLFNKITYHISRMLRYTNKFDVVGIGEGMEKLKRDEIKREIKKSLKEMTDIFGQGIDEGMSHEQAKKSYEEKRVFPKVDEYEIDSYQSSVEKFNSQVLEYFEYAFNIDRLKRKSFRDLMYVDRCFVGIVENGGEPVPMVFNPLNVGFHKSPDQEDISKGDYWWYRESITVAQAYDELADKFDDQELRERLPFIGTNGYPNERWDIKRGAQVDLNYQHVEDLQRATQPTNMELGYSTVNGESRNQIHNRRIFKTYLEFKAYRKVYYLTWEDEYGMENQEIVPDQWPVPKNATKVQFVNELYEKKFRYEWTDEWGKSWTAQELWMPRRYEVTRYHNDIYVNMREVPNQPMSVDDLSGSGFSLSLKGGVYTAVNSNSISLVERALPSYIQYIFIKMLMNKELAKYEGFIKNIDVSQIPDNIHLDSDGEPIYDGADKLAIWRYYRRTLGDSYFDPNQDTSGLPNYQKSTAVQPEIAGSMQEIMVMQQLLEVIDREISMCMLVPPQSEAHVDRYSNATDNQYAVQAGYIMSEDYYMTHSDTWKEVYSEYLNRFRKHWQHYFDTHPDKKEGKLQYQTSEGLRKVIRITPDILKHEDMMIFVRDGNYGMDYRNMIREQLSNFSQNQGQGMEMISKLVMDIALGKAPSEIHKGINEVVKDQQRRQEKLKEMESQAKIKEDAQKLKVAQQMHSQNIDEINLKNEGDENVKAMEIYQRDKELDAEIENNEKERQLKRELEEGKD